MNEERETKFPVLRGLRSSFIVHRSSFQKSYTFSVHSCPTWSMPRNCGRARSATRLRLERRSVGLEAPDQRDLFLGTMEADARFRGPRVAERRAVVAGPRTSR